MNKPKHLEQTQLNFLLDLKFSKSELDKWVLKNMLCAMEKENYVIPLCFKSGALK